MSSDEWSLPTVSELRRLATGTADALRTASVYFSVPANTEPPGGIFIKCPRTLTKVATGLRTQWVVFHSLPPIEMSLLCPACHQTHKWKSKDAWVAPD
jgi:hypothetical protein